MGLILFFGALTSKPYAFSSRPWELDSVETFDFFDSFGSRIRIDLRGGNVMRVLPRVDETLNGEWISDKTRFSYDGFRRQRLHTPLTRWGCTGFRFEVVRLDRLYPVSWVELHKKLSACKLAFTKARNAFHLSLGRFVDLETLYILKSTFLNGYEGFITLNQKAIITNVDSRSNYLVSPLSNLLRSDLLLLIGSNIRSELPVLATRIRSFVKAKGLRLFSVASGYSPLPSAVELGRSLNSVVGIVEGRHPFSQLLISAIEPVVLLGSAVINRRDGSSFYRLFSSLSATFLNSLTTNLIVDSPSSINVSELGISGFLHIASGSLTSQVDSKVIYLLGDDESDFEQTATDRMVIYQGHHGDRNAIKADFVLPGGLPIEKWSTMVDLYGKYRFYTPICKLPGEARPDWQIVLFLYSIFQSNFRELYPFKFGLSGVMDSFKEEYGSGLPDSVKPLNTPLVSYPMHFLNKFISTPVIDYYLSDSISRASSTMAASSRRLYLDSFNNFKSSLDFS